MRNKLKAWIESKKLQLAQKWAQAHGLLIVEIANVAGTDYIVCGDGSLKRIGAKRRQ